MIGVERRTDDLPPRVVMSRSPQARPAEMYLAQATAAHPSERRVLATMMFCDLRESTALAERLGPEGMVALLREYYALIDDCLHVEGGMLDKFIGDGIMAAFGVPVSGPNDEDRAVRAALAMTAALRRWNAERAARGLDVVEMGIGINTAIVVAGPLGSPRQITYTVTGAGVNLAARLEKACKRFSTAILIGEETVRRLKEQYPIRPIGTLARPGRRDPLAVYELIADHAAAAYTDLPAAIAAFSRGVALRQQGRLEAAAAQFRACLADNPADRCAALQLDACRLDGRLACRGSQAMTPERDAALQQ